MDRGNGQGNNDKTKRYARTSFTLRRSNHSDSELTRSLLGSSTRTSSITDPAAVLEQQDRHSPPNDLQQAQPVPQPGMSTSAQSSFTQRRKERGIAVPSSITNNWESSRPHSQHEPVFSSSTGSLVGDFDNNNCYGLSPFVTSSYTNFADCLLTPMDANHRSFIPQRGQFDTEYDGQSRLQGEEYDEFQVGSLRSSVRSSRPVRSQRMETEDSDIELSDDDSGKPSQKAADELSLFTLPSTSVSRRRHIDSLLSRRRPSSLMNSTHNENGNKAVSSSPPQIRHSLTVLGNGNDSKGRTPGERHSEILRHSTVTTTHMAANNVKMNRASMAPTQVGSTADRLKSFLPGQKPFMGQRPDDGALSRLGARPGTTNIKSGPLQNPPRKHILQTPVFQIVNANTIKDRYLFLFSDLLLICKPIMDENIIVNGSTPKNELGQRYRFRPNENSLFQVKNVVQLDKVTLYMSREEHYQRQGISSNKHQSMPSGSPEMASGTPPSPRKMHPLFAAALQEFEQSAEKGINYLIGKQVLPNDPLSIGNFLFKTPDLNRYQLGLYLADTRNAEVYNTFLDCFRLSGLRLDEALRILLTTFQLPDHPTTQDYIIEQFAKKWHDTNRNIVKFNHDMVVMVVDLMFLLNSKVWYDLDSSKDVYWFTHDRHGRPATFGGASSIMRDVIATEPLRVIKFMSVEQIRNKDVFVNLWKTYYDRYELVPTDFIEDMHRSILEERLETGWDTTGDADRVSGKNDSKNVITVYPYRLPVRLTKGVPSNPITISIPKPDKGLQIKLRGQDLVCEPKILDFSTSNSLTFTITGNSLGRASLMFIKCGCNASRYVSPTLPRTKSLIVERSFMRYTFQIGFTHTDFRAFKTAAEGPRRSSSAENSESPTDLQNSPKEPERQTTVRRKYLFSVETESERNDWFDHLRALCGTVIVGAESARSKTSVLVNKKREECVPGAEERVAFQVLREVLLVDEVKKGTANLAAFRTTIIGSSSSMRPLELFKDYQSKTSNTTNINTRNDDLRDHMKRRSNLDHQDRGSLIPVAGGGIAKRGHEVVKLVVQNSLIPLVLKFLRHQILEPGLESKAA